MQLHFVILEMEEDMRIPIILGRPFLATAGCRIDVCKIFGSITTIFHLPKPRWNLSKSNKSPRLNRSELLR